MNNVNRLICAVLLVITLLLSLCSCPSPYYYEDPLELELYGDVDMKSEYNQELKSYDVYLEGIAENTTGEDLVGCYATFTLFDADGNVVGTAGGYLNELKDGAKWRFSAYGSTDYEPSSFELTELSGYAE